MSNIQNSLKYKKYIDKLTSDFPCPSTKIKSVYLHVDRNEIFVILEKHDLTIINELRNTATELWGAYNCEVFLMFVGENKIDFEKFLANGYREVVKNA